MLKKSSYLKIYFSILSVTGIGYSGNDSPLPITIETQPDKTHYLTRENNLVLSSDQTSIITGGGRLEFQQNNNIAGHIIVEASTSICAKSSNALGTGVETNDVLLKDGAALIFNAVSPLVNAGVDASVGSHIKVDDQAIVSIITKCDAELKNSIEFMTTETVDHSSKLLIKNDGIVRNKLILGDVLVKTGNAVVAIELDVGAGVHISKNGCLPQSIVMNKGSCIYSSGGTSGSPIQLPDVVLGDN